MRNVASIFESIAAKAPPPTYRVIPPDQGEYLRVGQATEQYERMIRTTIFDVLSKAGTTFTLLSDDGRTVELNSDRIQYVTPSRLRYGVFDAHHGLLQSLRCWDGAGVYVSDDVAGEIIDEAIRRVGTSPPSKKAASKGGRSTHPAKAWYENRGFDRRELPMKELQAKMPTDAKGNPPCESTIRGWEREYRQKPPAETPK